ncbi:MAG: hypothetical protein SGBAC_009473 [Bacillariaceae sp.]
MAQGTGEQPASVALANVLEHYRQEKGSDLIMTDFKIPKLEEWLINEALEPDQSKLFMMEDITKEDLESAYDLLVKRKRMPMPKEFLDIAWDGASPAMSCNRWLQESRIS